MYSLLVPRAHCRSVRGLGSRESLRDQADSLHVRGHAEMENSTATQAKYMLLLKAPACKWHGSPPLTSG